MFLEPIKTFFDDIFGFFKYSHVFGIDIGTTAIKMVEVARKGDTVTLLNYGILETKEYLARGNAALQSSSLRISPEAIILYLTALLREVSPITKNVIVSLPVFGVFTTTLEIPLLSKDETNKSLGFQARQYIPLPLEEVTLEWVKTDEFKNDRGQQMQRGIMVAIPNELIKTYKVIVKSVGLTFSGFEVEVFALARALGSKQRPPTILIDIGTFSTSISVLEGTKIKYISQTDFAGFSFTRALSQSLSITEWRAEEIKRRRGISEIRGGEQELSTSLLPFLDVILQESERAREWYKKTYTKDIHEVMIVGGGANMPGIREYVRDQMRVTVSLPFPFERVAYSPTLDPSLRYMQNECSLALGLALKPFIKNEQ